MKFQEIFNEYIELLPYMIEHKNVFAIRTLYNSYIKNVFGEKEILILELTDYQNFANDLLFQKSHDGYMSRDRIEQIIDILISISRFAIKSNYGINENLPAQITLEFNESKSTFQTDFKNTTESINDNLKVLDSFLLAVVVISDFKKRHNL